MPIYEYKCDKCGDIYELIQSFSDEPLRVHEGCGGAVHRLISAPALQFKGSGWYITDYAKGSNTQAGKADNGGKGDTGKGDSGKSDGGKSDSGKTESGKSESGKSTESKPAATSASTDKK
jgi:putative FmdB family regulatory protein